VAGFVERVVAAEQQAVDADLAEDPEELLPERALGEERTGRR